MPDEIIYDLLIKKSIPGIPSYLRKICTGQRTHARRPQTCNIRLVYFGALPRGQPVHIKNFPRDHYQPIFKLLLITGCHFQPCVLQRAWF